MRLRIFINVRLTGRKEYFDDQSPRNLVHPRIISSAATEKPTVSHEGLDCPQHDSRRGPESYGSPAGTLWIGGSDLRCASTRTRVVAIDAGHDREHCHPRVARSRGS